MVTMILHHLHTRNLIRHVHNILFKKYNLLHNSKRFLGDFLIYGAIP